MPVERRGQKRPSDPFSPLEAAGAVELRPGHIALADWRAVYRGARVTLDFVARADVEAGAAAMAALAAAGKVPAPADTNPPLVADMVGNDGDTLPVPLIRLLMALKLAALAQGGSGVRWGLVETLSACLGLGLVPAVPASADSDPQALAHLYAMLTGVGDVLSGGRRRAAEKAFRKAGLAPPRPNDPEKRALLSGAEFSIALALGGLFEAETLLQSAVVAEALALDGTGEPVARRQRREGRSDVAAALASLLPRGGDETADERPASLDGAARTAAQLGASLDMLRHAGDVLQREANVPTEDFSIAWQTCETTSGGGVAPGIGLAGDLVARALGEVARLAERRLAGWGEADGAIRTDPQGMVFGFAAQIRERAQPVGFAQSEDCDAAPTMAGVERLRPLAGTVALVIAIAFLAACRARAASPETRPGDDDPRPLDAVRRLLAQKLPGLRDNEVVSAPEIAAAADLVRSGALAAAPGVALPDADPPARAWMRRQRAG